MSTALPWHVDILDRLRSLADSDQLPNAVALTCAPGWGHENLLANAVSTGAYVAEGLRALEGKHELIGDVRQKGMFFGLELV